MLRKSNSPWGRDTTLNGTHSLSLVKCCNSNGWLYWAKFISERFVGWSSLEQEVHALLRTLTYRGRDIGKQKVQQWFWAGRLSGGRQQRERELSRTHPLVSEETRTPGTGESRGRWEWGQVRSSIGLPAVKVLLSALQKSEQLQAATWITVWEYQAACNAEKENFTLKWYNLQNSMGYEVFFPQHILEINISCIWKINIFFILVIQSPIIV